ncbi:response regulator [Vibrio cholerae]|nr:response regulator [Vibrio cholerae]KFE19582.1 response regulator [Vibrio cholerae]
MVGWAVPNDFIKSANLLSMPNASGMSYKV